MWIENCFHFIYDYYRTLTDILNALYFILFERSEVKLHLFLEKIVFQVVRITINKMNIPYSYVGSCYATTS